MFTKNEQETRLLGFMADFIYFLGRIATAALAKAKRNVVVSAKSKQKRQLDARKHWA